MQTPAGYQWLIENQNLPALPRASACYIDSSVRARSEHEQGGQTRYSFSPQYAPEDNWVSHLQFALRYESVDLGVLALLFQSVDSQALCHWLQANPNSAYARRACFFYEWLTGSELAMESPVSRKTRYVNALDPDTQYCAREGAPSRRFRVTDNLPGTPAFCSLVRKTPALQAMEQKDLKTRVQATLANYDADLLRRAAAYLYLKETQSSFEVERETPSANKADRFAELLRQADTRNSLTEERLTQLQNAVIDPRFHEFTWRQQQNWIGKDMGYRQMVDFVPARPEDLPSLMEGLLSLADTPERHSDSIVTTAAIAFGFVYIHPFMDGNGRIHRYLIHHMLAADGFTPRGIVLPVSAVILANLDDYVQVLESFSRPLNQLTDYSPDVPDVAAKGNDALYFRYFDATGHAEFLCQALERTIEHDLQQEIDFLLGFDKAWQRLNALLDWPGHDLELFIRVVQQNEGILSRTKRKSHFDWMTDNEVAEAEAIVADAFAWPASGSSTEPQGRV
jgi:hypothetical protein